MSTALPQVLDVGQIEQLAAQVAGAARVMSTASDDALDRWSRLPEVFEVAGAEGAHLLLDQPNAAAQEFATVLLAASRLLDDYAMYVFAALHLRRASLAERIAAVSATTARSTRSTLTSNASVAISRRQRRAWLAT
ncbi:hypothetical protein [Microbacterium sp. SA39]|uniref:hypothetical protein n=1 Tax=Microbacterium sp. SA39 TaxID=1263625 RepID=UPI001F23FB40|nr:hypothetical protein [Microbacterium sp. SA39]